jgi:hypothetical protein
MAKQNEVDRRIPAPLAAWVWIVAMCCALGLPSVPSAAAATPTNDPALKMQALVMGMADDYIASLGESVYLLTRSNQLGSKGRWLAQSFLRNGVGAGLDIAVGPNPAVNALDLLVLTSLQTWSFETHWIPAGIGAAGRPALNRLKRAEADTWASAKKFLSEDQLGTVRALIDAWIAENPDRTVVALVRFEHFADERRMSSLPLRGKAHGLLKDVGEAVAVVDDTRMLGERLLWFAGRYPYLLGEQTELTAYRLMDQPEGVQLNEAIKSAQRLSDTLAKRIETVQSDLTKQQAAFFAKISAERAAAIEQMQGALQTTTKASIDYATESIHTQRSEAIDQFFDRFSQERKLLIDDLAARQNVLHGLITDLDQTVSLSGTLAGKLTETVNAVDKVVSHFDADPSDTSEPLRVTDVRDAAIEAGRAAERTTALLAQTIVLLESEAWDQRLSAITEPANRIVDRMFWRGVALICLLIVGLGLLRLIPRNVRGFEVQ